MVSRISLTRTRSAAGAVVGATALVAGCFWAAGAPASAGTTPTAFATTVAPTSPVPTTGAPMTTPPSTTPAASASSGTKTPTPSYPGPSRECSADYRLTGTYPTYFTAKVTVTATQASIPAWSVRWTWAGTQNITEVAGATFVQDGSYRVLVHSLSTSPSLPPSGTTTFYLWVSGAPTTPYATCTTP